MSRERWPTELKEALERAALDTDTGDVVSPAQNSKHYETAARADHLLAEEEGNTRVYSLMHRD